MNDTRFKHSVPNYRNNISLFPVYANFNASNTSYIYVNYAWTRISQYIVHISIWKTFLKYVTMVK